MVERRPISCLRLTSFLVSIVVLSLLVYPGSLTADSITPHFNRPPNSSGLTSAVTSVIDQADQYVYLAAYSMNSKPVVNRLIEAHKAGVTVRVVTEKDNIDKGGSYSGFASAYDKLSSKGITVKTDDKSALMHHKFVVVDDAVVLTGSTNLTEKQLNGDKNNMVEIKSSAVAYHYKQEFQAMWNGAFGNDKTNDPLKAHSVDNSTLTAAFSPNADGTSQIIDVLNTADRNVFFNVFTFTHETIADRMIQLHDNGVNVRGTFDAWQADGSFYVKKIFDKLTGESVPVRMDDYRGLLHDKFIVIDGNTNSNPTLITGSYNWTASANESNDENFVIIRDPEVVNRYYENARNTYLNHAVKPDWQAPLSSLVNVNTASKAKLRTLDGIGPATARAIITYRSDHEPFRTAEELSDVSGIGPATVEKIKDYVTFGRRSGFVDINRASAKPLRSVNGIGSVTAESIVNYRSNNGDFSSVDQLTKVDGIGPATLESIRDDVKATNTEPALININQADTSVLMTLEGIGAVTAKKIVAERTVSGEFTSIEGLTRVGGIGSATIDNFREKITVGESQLININTAEQPVLESLSGIGPSTAQNIVTYRDGNDSFSTESELKEVDGIGTVTYQILEDKITY